jgi:hypothetical protein
MADGSFTSAVVLELLELLQRLLGGDVQTPHAKIAPPRRMVWHSI